MKEISIWSNIDDVYLSGGLLAVSTTLLALPGLDQSAMGGVTESGTES